MQTTPLPSLNANTNANAAPQRSGESDGGAQFGATLSREIGQRNTAAQQAPAAGDGAAKAQQQAPQQQQASADAAPQPAKADAKPADGKPAGDAKEGDDKDDAAAANTAAAAAPVTDMLAMVASVAQLLQGAVAPAAAPTADGKTDTKGVGAASSQLAGIAVAAEGADPDTAIPTEAAARFAALIR